MPVSAYISKAFQPNLPSTVKRSLKVLKEYQDQFDCIAVRGTSGLIMGSILSFVLKKPLIVVRKPKAQESTHASYEVECSITEGTYLIVDDIIGSGDTVRTIQTQIAKHHPEVKSNGCVFLYYSPEYCYKHLYPSEKI